MKRKTILSATAAVLFVGSVSAPAVAFADKLTDAKKKAQELAQQQKNTQNNISKLKQQESSLQSQISQLEAQVENLQKSIVTTQADIVKRTQQIKELQQKIDDTQQQIDEQYAVLEQRLRIMYEDGNTSYIDVLFSSTSFSDLLDRMQMLSLVAQQDKNVLDTIRADKADLDNKNAQMKQQLAQVQAQNQALLTKKQQQETAQNNEKALLVKVHDARVSQEAELKGENSAMQNLQSLISQLEAAEGGYSGPASGWTWPVPGHTYISSPYGWRSWSDGSREFHNGIDIPAPLGTPMVAATSGKVMYAGPASGFGDWIVIESSGGLLEIYGHMYAYQIKVSPGEVVHTGQQIASVGSNGFSTGPHLHFTVAKGFDSSGFPISINPMNYLH